MSTDALQTAPAIPRRFTGKIVVITGATAGIDSATARRLAAEDATLVLAGRQRDAAETLLADLKKASFVAGAARERASAHRVVAHALERHGHLDVLVNNAAINHTGDVLETPNEEVRALFEINLFGAIHRLHAAGRAMRRRGAAIVNLTPRLASIGVPTMAMSSAAEGARLSPEAPGIARRHRGRERVPCLRRRSAHHLRIPPCPSTAATPRPEDAPRRRTAR